MKAALRFLKSEDGPTSVEYAVMLALIITVALTSITTLGASNSGFWGHISTSADAAFDAAHAANAGG
jgi:pilus assembly protein Flp/PilA